MFHRGRLIAGSKCSRKLVFQKNSDLPQILDLRTVVLYKWGPKICCLMIHVYDRLIITYIYKYRNDKHSVPSRLFSWLPFTSKGFCCCCCFMSMGVFPTFMPVHMYVLVHLCLCTRMCWWLQRSKASVRSPITGVPNDCESAHGCWKFNLGPLKKHSALLTAEQSYQHHRYLYVSASNQYELSTSRTMLMGDLIGSKETNNPLIDVEINITLSWKVIWCLINPHPISQCFSLL